MKVYHGRGNGNFLEGSGDMLLQKIWKSGASEMLFSVFWGGNLQNSKGCKMPYKILILGEIDMGLKVALVSST